MDVFHQPTDERVAQLAPLFHEVERHTGERALPDHHWLELHGSAADGFVGAISWADEDPVVPSAYAQVSRIGAVAVAEVVVGSHPSTDGGHVLRAALESLAGDDTTEVQWWVHGEPVWQSAVATALRFDVGRSLLQMRCSLPLSSPNRSATINTRSFTMADAESWVAVNNRAFAGHGEQGSWTAADVHRRMAEDWFDPNGFLLHDRDERLAGFCWTKIHPGDPPLGEIYVIAVDPDFMGLGLGRQLVIAGLASLTQRGLRHGLLYVDGHNAAAVGLYRSLGFEVARHDQVFTAGLGELRALLASAGTRP